MGMAEQAEIARKLTGSTLDNSDIIFGLTGLKEETKVAICWEIDILIRVLGLPFLQAFPLLKEELEAIAYRNNIEMAKLCWIYMRWLEKR